jgi:glycosyltransferase involved in cell wall biosynthesis
VRIALITAGLFPWRVGGIEKHTANLLREWTRLGVAVDVYFPDDLTHPSDELIAQIHLPGSLTNGGRFIRYVPRRKACFPLHHYVECYWDSVAVDHLLDQDEAAPDFIYVQGYQGLELFRNKRNGKHYPPIGVNLHGVNAWQRSWFSAKETVLKLVCRPMEKFMLANADVALSLGGRIDDTIRRVAPSVPIIRSANGIAPEWVCDGPGEFHRPTRFVFVGRNERAKGLHLLYQALSEIWPRDPFELHVVSPIDKSHQLEEPWIKYHGGISNEPAMRNLLRSMDVLVNPSRTEGVPTVVLEGMASGLAIIATDVGATCELVADDNGWLIPSNCVEALRKALGEALHLDPSRLGVKKRASLERVKSHLWPKVAKDTLHSIEGFLRQRTASAP